MTLLYYTNGFIIKSIAVKRYIATVGFSLESANVVGYAQSGLRSGSKGIGACFAPMSGTNVNLQDLKVVGYEGENADTVNVQILDSLGRTVKTYFWADLPDDDIYGWLDESEEIPEDVEFAMGEGLYFVSSEDGLSLQTAGAVPSADIAVALRNGSKMVANPMPTIINLQDIVIGGYEGENADCVNLQILDSLGRTVKTYFWADLPDDDIYGWLDEAEEIPEDVEINAGEGLYIVSAEAGLTINFPAPTL